jgi:hypothetical protein
MNKIRALLLGTLALTLSASAPLAAGNKPYIIDYAETKSLFVNKTMVTYDRAHGTQVEYIAANGKTYLLYPGNKVVVRGNWKLSKTKTPKVFELCFKYGANTYNPATGNSGGGWECQAAGFYLVDVVDTGEGDVLGLAAGKEPPFELSRRKASLQQLLRLAARSR